MRYLNSCSTYGCFFFSQVLATHPLLILKESAGQTKWHIKQKFRQISSSYCYLQTAIIFLKSQTRRTVIHRFKLDSKIARNAITRLTLLFLKLLS